MDWFLYDRDLRHERVKNKIKAILHIWIFIAINLICIKVTCYVMALFKLYSFQKSFGLLDVWYRSVLDTDLHPEIVLFALLLFQ